MSSFVTIELDTSPPQLEIYTPSFTTQIIENYITIKANEELGTYQEIYITDSKGNRHNYIFQLDKNQLVGSVIFNDVPLGSVTLYAKVNDTVDNFSSLYHKNIEIKENISRLRMDISQNTRPLSISILSRGVIVETNTREVIVESNISEMKLSIET